MAGYGAKFDRWVAEARALGLEVKVETREESEFFTSVTATISRPQVEEVTMLDVVRNYERLNLHAVRCGSGKWSNHASRIAMGAGYSKVKRLSLVPYWIRGMAEGD